MTIKRELSSRRRLQVERGGGRGAGARPEEEQSNYSHLCLHAASRAHPFYLFLVCPVCPPRAFFPIRYIIYFERVHLKNWLSRVRVLAAKWSLRAGAGGSVLQMKIIW